MILARNSITLHHLRDITTVVWYYKLQASTASPPTKPTTETPSGWSTTEPSYTEGSTNSLYVVQKTTFSDGSFEYSDVSLSTSYEAAKAAYNKSVQAKDAADAAQESIDNLQVGGRNLILNTLYPNATGSNLKRPHIFGQISNTSGRGTASVAEHGIRFTTTSENWQYIYFGSSSNTATPCMLGLEAGETYTLSADLSWKILSSEAGMADTETRYMGAMLFCSTVESGSWSAIGTIDGFPITQADKGTEMSGRLEYTFTVPMTAKRLYLGIRSGDSNASHYGVGDYIEARNLKLEKGNKATDWTPAPEDVETDINEAKKTATNYISADNTGIMVANMADGNTYTPSNVPSGTKNTFIDEDSFQVRDGTDVLASFGEESRIGKEDANHLNIDATGIQGVNPDGANFFNVDMDGAVTDALISPNTRIVSISGVSADNSKTATVSLEPFSMANKTVKLHIWSLTRPTGSQQYTTFNDDFIFEYGTDASFHNIYGAYSVRVTYSASADTVTIQGSAFMGTGGFVGSSDVSLVSYYRATYAPAFYFGSRRDYNVGDFSATLGESLSASSRDQFACGRYNTEDPDYAFMVGNGDTNGDSNALAVTWDGNQLMALDETATTGTDAELYSAITALGWESEVLV